MVSKKKGAPAPKSAGQVVEAFDKGQDVSAYIPGADEPQRVNVDFPAWVVAALDMEAARRGLTRQGLIKTWTVDMLEAKGLVGRVATPATGPAKTG